MRLTLLIAFRNIFRQKSRTIFIGSGVCVAVIYMILSGALTRGLYSNVIAKIVESNLYGHVSVNIYEKDGLKTRSIIRDKDKIIAFIKKQMPGVKEVKEYVNTNTFAVGNGEGCMLQLTGVSASSIDSLNDIVVLSGDLTPFSKGSTDYPLILEKNTAKRLKVKVGDIVKVRLTTIYGQVQTAQLNLVAIVEYKNTVMSMAMPGVIPFHILKKIIGYQPQETQQLHVELKRLNESDEMIFAADLLHKVLQPYILSLGKSWKLADRTYSQTAYEKKIREIRKSSYDGSIMDIACMQEYAEDTFNSEKGGKLISFIAILIVISIILVGILNTMRMNIRERTREIGTVRAIGMQRKTVVRALVLEVILLSIFSTIIGLFAAIGLMELFSMIQFNTSDLNISLILNNGHPVFKIPVGDTVFNILLVFCLLILSAWLPARKAVRKTVADALGHYE